MTQSPGYCLVEYFPVLDGPSVFANGVIATRHHCLYPRLFAEAIYWSSDLFAGWTQGSPLSRHWLFTVDCRLIGLADSTAPHGCWLGRSCPLPLFWNDIVILKDSDRLVESEILLCPIDGCSDRTVRSFI